MSTITDKLWAFLDGEPDTLVRMLFRAEKHLTKRSLEELRVVQNRTVTESQLQVIRQLCFGNARTTEIAEALDISKQAVSQLLVPLIEDGIIEQVKDEEDGRAKINKLTPMGVYMFDQLLAQTIELEQEVRNRIGHKKLKEFKKALQEILEV